MILVSTTLQPSLGIAFGLTALLAASAGHDELWRRKSLFARVPRWLPCLLLVLLGIASTGFGILYPDAFAAIGGEGIFPPGVAAAP